MKKIFLSMVLVFALTVVSCKPSTAVEKEVETEVVTDTTTVDTLTIEDAEPIIRQDEAEVN